MMSRKDQKREELIKKHALNEIKSVDETVKTVKEVSTSKFTGSVNVDIILNLKEKDKKESIKGTVTFPNQFGKPAQVVVLCEDTMTDKAKSAGAVEAGLEEVVKKIENGNIEYDVIIATPSVMPKIAKLGKVLGPKGLMPNPKNGTVTEDIEKAVNEFSSGKVSFSMEPKQGTIRGKVARLDMDSEKIKENFLTYLKSVVNEAKKFAPTNTLKKVVVAPTMGPGIKVDVNDIIASI